MAFSVKDWHNSGTLPDTPLSAPALEDMETRLSAYTDTWEAVWRAVEVTRGKGVIIHGTAGNTARPTEYRSVEWIGSVVPANAINNDTWVDTS